VVILPSTITVEGATEGKAVGPMDLPYGHFQLLSDVWEQWKTGKVDANLKKDIRAGGLDLHLANLSKLYPNERSIRRAWLKETGRAATGDEPGLKSFRDLYIAKVRKRQLLGLLRKELGKPSIRKNLPSRRSRR
jgi:hypothetical protein